MEGEAAQWGVAATSNAPVPPPPPEQRLPSGHVVHHGAAADFVASHGGAPPPQMMSPMRYTARGGSGPAVVKEHEEMTMTGAADKEAEERLARSEMMQDVLQQVNRLSHNTDPHGAPRRSGPPEKPRAQLPGFSFAAARAPDDEASSGANPLFGGLLDSPLPVNPAPRPARNGTREPRGRARCAGSGAGGGPPTAPGPWRPAPATRGNPRFLEKALGIDSEDLFPPGERGPPSSVGGASARRSGPTSGRPGHRGQGQPSARLGHKMTTQLPPVRAPPTGRPKTGSSTGYAMYVAVPNNKPRTPRGRLEGGVPDPVFPTGHGGTAVEDFSPKGTHLEGLVYGTS